MVYPTQLALDVLPTVKAVVREWNEFITEGFSADELEQLEDMLERIAQKARDYDRLTGGNE